MLFEELYRAGIANIFLHARIHKELPTPFFKRWNETIL
jgi:hypothetical protein